MGRISSLALIAVFGIALASACQSDTHAVFSPPPSPTPHAAPTAAILQPAEVPPSLQVCLGSGPIDVYVANLAGHDATVASKVGAAWEQLALGGATAGAVSVYTSAPSACATELGVVSNARSITSFVAEFADPAAAEQAWQSGIFGFTPPAPGELMPGVTRGTGTGLGLSSWIYDQPPLRIGCWHRSVFVALVIAASLDAATFKSATAAVDARLD